MNEVRFGIVGAGSAGKAHAQAVETIPGARVAVVSNRAEERGRRLAEAFGAEWEPDWHTAVARDDVDVVCVCTASGTHAEIAVEAANAHKHVIVEKPIDVTLERCDQIVQAAEQAGVRMTCIFQSRFATGVRKAKEAIDAGRLGRLVLAGAFIKWYRSTEYYAESGWRGTWALDGGAALMNQGIHSIDLLQWLGGQVETVFGVTTARVHPIEAEDTGSAVLAFRDGAQGVIQGSTACWPGDPARIELHGEAGTIVLEDGCIVRWDLADAEPDERDEMLRLGGVSSGSSADPSGFGYELHRRQIVDFLDAIEAGRPPVVDEAEARKALEIVLAIYASNRSGATATLPLAS